MLTSDVVEGSKCFLGGNWGKVANIAPDGPPVSVRVMGNISPLVTLEVTAFGGGGHKPFLWVPLKNKS